MKIELMQNELEDAVTDYLGHMGIATNNRTVEVRFIATRKPPSTTAEVIISEASDEEPVQDVDQMFSGPEDL